MGKSLFKNICSFLRLGIIRHKIFMFLVNRVYVGTKPKNFNKKRILLNALGYKIEEGSKIVGPIFCSGKLIVGKNTWVGRNFVVDGDGTVVIGDNCDIGPEVSFQTGGHEIGSAERRAGKGLVHNITVGNGVWICAKSTFANSIKIGNSSVIAACSFVNKDVEDNSFVGGIPAKFIRKLI